MKESVSGYFSRSLKTASPNEVSSSKGRTVCTVRMLLSSKVFLVVRFSYQLQRHGQVLLSVARGNFLGSTRSSSTRLYVVFYVDKTNTEFMCFSVGEK